MITYVNEEWMSSHKDNQLCLFQIGQKFVRRNRAVKVEPYLFVESQIAFHLSNKLIGVLVSLTLTLKRARLALGLLE